MDFSEFYQTNVIGRIQEIAEHPLDFVLFIIDIAIVLFLIYKIIKLVKNSRGWQVLKGIALLIIATWVSGLCRLTILHAVLDKIMSWGVIAIIIIFQPEIRRALEQLGSNRIRKFLGFEEDIETKTKEDIYKIVIAAEEMAKRQIGALIVIERDIGIKDITDTGILINAEVSPQLLTNIFVPKTPLHDGAVIISDNKIKAAACMLPLANDQNIAKDIGTRHRAGIGISKESDAIAVIVSEETGKISIAKDGSLIVDVSTEKLKKILIQNIITNRFTENEKKTQGIIKNIKNIKKNK